MPPQTPSTPSIPGADVLLNTLRLSSISNEERQQLWDVYHTPGDEKAFTGAINKLPLNDETKQILYDMRFKGFQNQGNTSPSATPTKVPEQVKGDLRSTTGSRSGVTWDKIQGEYYPRVLSVINKGLQYPLISGPLTGGRTISEGLQEDPSTRGILESPAGQSAAIDTQKLALKIAGGITDFIQSPAGIAATIATVGTEGAAAPWIAGGYTSSQAPSTIDAIQKAHQKPSPENVQDAFYQTAMLSAMGAGGKMKDIVKASPRVVRPGYVKNLPGAYSETGMFKGAQLGENLGSDIMPRDSEASLSTQLGYLKGTKTPQQPAEARAPMVRSFIGQPNPLDMPTTVKYSKQGNTLGLPDLAFNADEPVSEAHDPSLFIAEPKALETSTSIEPVQASQPNIRELKDQLGQKLGQQLGIEYRGLQEDIEGNPNAATERARNGVPDHLIFQDPKSDNSLVVPLEDATLEGTRSRLEAMRKSIEKNPPAPLPILSKSNDNSKSFDIPDQLRKNFDLVADLERQQDIAVSNAQRDSIAKEIKRLKAQNRTMLKTHIGALTSEQLLQLRDKTKDEADKLDAQSKAISDLTDDTIRNRSPKKEIATLRSTGGPIREMVVNSKTGERAVVKPEAQIARGARSIFDELQGRIPTSDFENLKINAKPEGVPDEEWTKHVDKLQDERQGLKKKISDVVMTASKTGSSLFDTDLEEHVNKLKEIEGLLGKYTEEAKSGRRSNIPVEVDKNGAIKATEKLKSWTLERAEKALDKRLRQMPSDEEFYQEADIRTEKARQLRIVSDVAEKVRQIRNASKSNAERGGIGEVINSPFQVTLKRTPIPSDTTLIERAKKLGQEAYRVSDDKPAGSTGWLSSNGESFIDSGSLQHADLSSRLLPENESVGSAYKDMLSAGWIRKVNLRTYEFERPTSQIVHAIEMDTIRNAVAGKDLLIDMQGPRGIRSMHIPAGWENLKDEIVRAQRDPAWRLQTGRISGIASLSGMAIGGVAGTVAGAHFAGPGGAIVGGSIGMVAGFITPAILLSRSMRVAMTIMAPIVRGAGMSLRLFLSGTPQFDVGTPEMKQILAAQEAHATRSTNWIERAKKLPSQIYKGFDPFAYIADKRNMGMVGRVLMSFDKDGKVFRDLTIPDTQSLYVALRMAGGEALGQRAYQGFQYNDIKSDAAKAGLRPALDVFLNLKGYERVHEVLAEHSQDLQQSIQQIQQNLQNPNNSLRQTAALQDSLREAQSMQREIHRKVQSGEATPGGYTPSKIQAEYANLQQQLGQQKFAALEQLAQRSFQVRSHILDMLHSNGLISLEDYLTYMRRGPEYVPMERIMDDLAGNKFASSTKPLHLRHQTVIQQLEGSTRTNVNPWEAFDHADRKAFNQIYRNAVMTQALDLAHTYPQTIGQEFQPVAADYRAKEGEGIVGHYQDGKPQLYAVPKYLADTMTMLPGATKTALGAAANWFGHQFKKVATVGNIGFQVSSLISHALSSAILPEQGLRFDPSLPAEATKFLNGWMRSVKSVLNQDQNYREMVRSGGAFGTFQRALDPEYFANPSDVGFMGKLAKGRILDAAQDLAAGLEDINRVNTFIRARQAGLNERAAGWQTKQFGGAPDFSRLGDMSQPINQALMFFNAANQYLTQATSAIRKDPMRMGGLMVAMTAGMIALNSWNSGQKDSKGNDLLRKESIFDRQRNWLILTPYRYTTSNGTEKAITLKIPKPKIAQLLNPIDDLVNYATNKEDRTGTQQALDSISNVSPIHLRLKEGQVGKTFMQSIVSSAHPILKTAVEQYANVNDFGQSIVPESQQNIDSRYQIGPNTSPIAQRMGEGGIRGAVAGGALGTTLGTTYGGLTGGIVGGLGGTAIGASGLSPRRIDAGVQSLTAGGGAMAEGYLNPFFHAVTGTKQMEGPEMAQNIPVAGLIVKRFTTNPMDATEQALTSRFYQTAQRMQQPMQTLQFLEKNHPDQVENYQQQHKDELWKSQMAQEMTSRLNDLSQSQHEIENAKGIDEAKRVQVLKNIHEVKIQILRTFTGVLEKPDQISTQPGAGTGNAH